MIVQADARQIPLRDGCVQCVVTSPPYWGLRDYGVAGQIGLEASPEAYVADLVAVFREVRRVLADDGVLWLNLGDSYAAHPGQRKDTDAAGSKQQSLRGSTGVGSRVVVELKPKDLVGIPWRVAFALQADGWYLRSDIIWSKPNPMPESVTDRPTKAHEYVFLLAKSERYYYDAEAIKERGSKPAGANGTFGNKQADARLVPNLTGNMRPGVEYLVDGTRNARSVWTINPKPYAGAHFATMPADLAERCIKAGSRPGDLVFDPFGGSGTTLRVARELNRRGVMLDLNPAYLQLAKVRGSEIQPSILELPA